MFSYAAGSASGEADVQILIAQRDIAWKNGDTTTANAITAQLNALGYQ